MIIKTRWIDKLIPESIESVFTEFGEKIEFMQDDIVLDRDEKSRAFYYVNSGLLAVTLYETFCDAGTIVKFIPEGRMFGFSEFFFGKKQNFRLSAIRDCVIYKISYETMECIIKKRLVNKNLFRFYGRRAIETKHATHAAMVTVEESAIPSVVGAGLTTVKEWDEFGRYSQIVKLTPKELHHLKYIGRKRNGFRRGKEKVQYFHANA